MQTIRQFPSWLSKQKLSGKVAIGCAGLVLLCCICGVPVAIFSPSTPTPEVTETAIVEVSPSPIAEPATPTETALAEVLPTETIAPSNIPQPTATEETTALLPGLMPADVTVNLEQRGFTCGTPEQGQLYYTRTCTNNTADYLIRVDIYGREAFSVDFLESSVLQFANPDNEFAASFLGFLATMPYDGAVQEEARNWVETTLPTLQGVGDVREEIFAGVKYRLYGIPTAFTLEMGDLP